MEYYKTLNDVDRNMPDQAQVPCIRHHCGNGRISRGEATWSGLLFRVKTAKYCEMESKFVSLLVEWGTKHDVKLANTFCKEWEPTRAKTNRLDFWRQSEVQFQKWKIMDLLFPSSGK